MADKSATVRKVSNGYVIRLHAGLGSSGDAPWEKVARSTEEMVVAVVGFLDNRPVGWTAKLVEEPGDG